MKDFSGLNVIKAHNDDAMVSLAGDWHGNTPWVMKAVDWTAAAGSKIVLHLGDFGIWPGPSGKKYLSQVSKKCDLLGLDIVVTLGNHEDWNRIEGLWENDKRRDDSGNPLPIEIEEHVVLLPRPYRFMLGGKSFLSLGGAASVDVDGRTNGRDWWPDEALTVGMVEAAKAGGYADVMLTHETPDVPFAVQSVEDVLRGNPLGFSQFGLNYSAQSRRFMTEVFESVKPKLLAHGHMHVSGTKKTVWDDGSTSEVWALDCEYTQTNLIHLKIEAI